MKFLDQAHRLIDAGDGSIIPVALFIERGGDLSTVEVYSSWGGDLALAKADLFTAVDRHAEALRLALVGTDSTTQLEVYRNKYERAKAEDLDFLADEADARGLTVEQLAALVIAKGDEWRVGGQLIETSKGAHKAAIAALEDTAAAEAYDITTGWPA